MTFLPLEIFTLTRITDLNIQRNFLTSIPPAVSCLGALTALSVATNPLNTLPAELGLCTRLSTLRLGKKHSVVVPVWEVLNQGPGPTLEYLRRVLVARKSNSLNISDFSLTRIPPEVTTAALLAADAAGGHHVPRLQLDVQLDGVGCIQQQDHDDNESNLFTPPLDSSGIL